MSLTTLMAGPAVDGGTAPPVTTSVTGVLWSIFLMGGAGFADGTGDSFVPYAANYAFFFMG